MARSARWRIRHDDEVRRTAMRRRSVRPFRKGRQARSLVLFASPPPDRDDAAENRKAAADALSHSIAFGSGQFRLGNNVLRLPLLYRRLERGFHHLGADSSYSPNRLFASSQTADDAGRRLLRNRIRLADRCHGCLDDRLPWKRSPERLA